VLSRFRREAPALTSPTEILIKLITEDILRHAYEWPNLIGQRNAYGGDDRKVIRRKGYSLEFVPDPIWVSPHEISKGLRLTMKEAEVLQAALRQAHSLYKAVLDAEAEMQKAIKENAEETTRQMAACDAIERFMTCSTT
jgi:hypothetical protein